jgi:hypothetical protein
LIFDEMVSSTAVFFLRSSLVYEFVSQPAYCRKSLRPVGIPERKYLEVVFMSLLD